MSKIDVSICIVAYKAYSDLSKCLRSISALKTKRSYEVIVVDNNEEAIKMAPLLRKYPFVRYIKSPSNKGYGAGNNLAIANAKGDYLLILNPDTELYPDTLEELCKFLKAHPKAAIVAPTLLNKSSEKYVQLGSGELTPIRAIFSHSIIHRIFPNNPIARRYKAVSEQKGGEARVSAVPGSAFLMRKSAFIEVGGYDENLFLYYEESDIGRRLSRKGYELWIIQSAQVKHKWGRSTQSQSSDSIQRIFEASRYYYFKKHFGVGKALIVEFFSRIGKYEMLFMFLFLISAFLRFYRVNENLVFHGELGDNYLAIKNILVTGVIPLLGPPTSHPWLSFGPLYYWIFSPVLLFAQYNPLGVAYSFAFINTFLVGINYLVVSKLLGKRTALISSIIIALSPQYLIFARESRFFSLTLLLFYPIYYYFLRKRYFLGFLWFSIMLNFHLTPIIYVPAIALFLYGRKNELSAKIVRNSLFGFFIPQLPFIAYNLLHKGEMLSQSLLWIPYRIAGFFGLVPQNNATAAVVTENNKSLIDFASSIFVKGEGSILFVLFIGGIIAYCWVYRRRVESIFFLLLLLICGLIGIFIHGAPPSHYYLPLYGPTIIMISYAVSLIRPKFLVLLAGLFFGITYINFNQYFSEKWFYIDQSTITSDKTVPFWLQEVVTDEILLNAKNDTYSLARVGPSDHFEQNYAQNYRYLLWMKGNEPVSHAQMIYTIYESEVPENRNEIIFQKSGIYLTLRYVENK